MAERIVRPQAQRPGSRPPNEETRNPRGRLARPESLAKPWLDELEDLSVNAEGRVGDDAARREAFVAGAEALHTAGDLEWGKDYPGYGGTGCVSLPFLAAAKAGLISMAQAVRLSKDPRSQEADMTRIILDIFGYVGWSKAPDSRKWGHPTCKPKKGDIAVFASKKNDADFAHAAILASAAGDMFSLEPNASGDPAKLRMSHVNSYISEQKALMTQDPDMRVTEQEAEDALGCIVCPFPF